MEEFRFIDWIRQATEASPERVPVGPGDDCAVLAIGDQRVMVTTDQCGDGVHFRIEQCGYEPAGYKVMARSLSDIAAMAGTPLAAVATVALPPGASDADAQAIYHGLRRAGDAFDCPVIGGDVSAWGNPLLLTVTMLGTPPTEGAVLRSGAQVGDAICVTGALGGSLPNGHHLAFTPRLAEARQLLSFGPVHAMIDISDGLAGDLRHICRESGTGAELRADAIPLTEAAAAAADPLAAALGDGEDYELLFTLPTNAAEKLTTGQPLAVPVTRIGTIVAAREIHLLRNGQPPQPLAKLGFRHHT